MLLLAAITLLLYLAAGLEVTIRSRRLRHLIHIPPIDDDCAPRISVIIPACNEERNIESALASVIAQDYPDFEIIAIDDRSTDSTGAILDRVAAQTPNLRVVHITQLPAGWLGKNHALQMGADSTTGSVLLFSDADVVMHPSVLRRAARYLVEHDIDHLAIPPRAIVHGFLAKAFLGAFALLFTIYTKPWKVSDPKAREHIGIGAFNMIRTAAYQTIGGHRPIAMRPDDDMKLGKLVKLRGFKQDMVFGTELLSVEWYASFREMRNGLMKNFFAALDYSLLKLAAAAVGQFALLIWPFVAILVTRGATEWLNAATVALLLITFAINAPRAGISWVWGFAMPIAGATAIYLMTRSALFTLKNGGIEWRGTRYPIAQLRANRL